MPGTIFSRFRTRMVRFLEAVFGIRVGSSPANHAGRVAGRLRDSLTLEQHVVLGRHFGIEYVLLAAIVENDDRSVTARRFIHEFESKALIRLHRWERRKIMAPALQKRLARSIGKAHAEILDLLCDAPPIRPVLIAWHDQLVDGRRSASEIADHSGLFAAEDADEDPQMAELALAAILRKAIWAHTLGCKALRDPDGAAAVRDSRRDWVCTALHAARFNAHGIDALAESLLGHARRMCFEAWALARPEPGAEEDADTQARPPTPAARELYPVDIAVLAERNPLFVENFVAESGMTLQELWHKAVPIDAAMKRARRGRALLVASGTPMLAEQAAEPGIGEPVFWTRMELGRAALMRYADRFCYIGDGNFTANAEQVIRQAMRDAPTEPPPPITL